jgi:hypothetical protein
MNLWWVEIRRSLRRRMVRVMVLLALAGCAFAGVVAYLSSAGQSLAEMRADESANPALLVEWWVQGEDSLALTAALFLLIGGFLCGAAVVGAEWRAGTVTTVLTWEPRRVRLAVARVGACGICAFLIAVALQAVFFAALLLAVLVNGSTDGTTAGWWMSFALVVVRTAGLTAIAAILGAALATIGRNTAFALGVVFGWLAVVEGLIRGLRPGWAGYLWGENVAIVVPWAGLQNVEFQRDPAVALATVLAYTAVLVVVAAVLFARRDIAGSG